MTPTDTIRDQLNEIRARLDAVGPGPWNQTHNGAIKKLIVKAPQDLRRLLDALELATMNLSVHQLTSPSSYTTLKYIAEILKC
jgi:hypothetical protein